MEKADNEMYALVDEEFLAKFSNQHLNYMKKLYYSFYAGYCKRIKRKPLTSEDFFKNIDAVTIISNLYLKEYYQRRNRVIANYYFNKENAYDFFADTE